MSSITYESREAWLAARRDSIGASESAAALGLCPWKSAYTLWAEKRGLIPPSEETIAMRVGSILEPLVADLYAQHTGRPVEIPPPFTVWAHPNYPFITCTPDRFTYRDDARGPLELKTAGIHRAAEWREEPPQENQVQHQHQMFVLTMEWGSLAALVGNREFFSYDFERHDRFIKRMFRGLCEFWERVQDDDPPPVDGSDSTARTLSLLHPRDTGEIIPLSPNAKVLVERLAELKEKEKEISEEKQLCENMIKEEMGYASFGELPDCRVSWKWQSRKEHVVKASEFRVLRITNKKEK